MNLPFPRRVRRPLYGRTQREARPRRPRSPPTTTTGRAPICAENTTSTLSAVTDAGQTSPQIAQGRSTHRPPSPTVIL